MAWAVDLDGVVWLGGRAIPGSAEAVARLRSAGQRVVFLTNNSGPSLAEHLAALSAAGIEADASDVATSAQAAASIVGPGTRVAVVGASGLLEALAAAEVDVVEPDKCPAAIVVGRTTELDYDRLAAVATALRQGARFIATNTDATFPAGEDLLPGAGALVAFLATASGRQPEVAGKPHGPMAELVKARYGAPSVVAGDRPDTDGAFAKLVGASFGLVLSGVTKLRDLPVEPAPDFVGKDLLDLVKCYLGQAGRSEQPGL